MASSTARLMAIDVMEQPRRLGTFTLWCSTIAAGMRAQAKLPMPMVSLWLSTWHSVMAPSRKVVAT